MARYYAGIGARNTPGFILKMMDDLAKRLHAAGFSLRSGHAEGADLAFEEAVKDVDKDMQIFLPWPKFNGAPVDDPRYIHGATLFNGAWADMTVDKYHPDPDRLSQGSRRLMARNACQILGEDGKSPSEFVVCWTRDGMDSGGTGQAIRIAWDKNITVYNLFSVDDYQELIEDLKL